jgi:hypothetical protein
MSQSFFIPTGYLKGQVDSYGLIASLAHFFLLQRHYEGVECYSTHIQNAAGAALCAFKMLSELFYITVHKS